MPMSPEYLLEALLLLAGTFVWVIALRFLFTRQSSKALKAAAVGLACFVIAFVLVKTVHNPPKTAPVLRPASENSMSLVLGGVVLRVAPSSRYVLSVDNRKFLELESRRSQLRVSSTVGSGLGTATKIVQNAFPVRTGDVHPGRDAHTLFVQAEGKSVFRVHYSEPLRIEVTGDFFDRRKSGSVLSSIHLISFQKGIEWTGGRIPEGTTLDLRKAGAGRIDFGPSGSIRVVHPSTRGE